jgi:hypothetical protein
VQLSAVYHLLQLAASLRVRLEPFDQQHKKAIDGKET